MREGDETEDARIEILFLFPPSPVYLSLRSRSYRSGSGLIIQAVVPERAQGEWGQMVERGRRGRDGRNQPRHHRRCRGRRRRRTHHGRGRQRVSRHVLGRQRGHVLVLEARDGVVGPRGQGLDDEVVVGDERRGGAGAHLEKKFKIDRHGRTEASFLFSLSFRAFLLSSFSLRALEQKRDEREPSERAVGAGEKRTGSSSRKRET